MNVSGIKRMLHLSHNIDLYAGGCRQEESRKEEKVKAYLRSHISTVMFNLLFADRE